MSIKQIRRGAEWLALFLELLHSGSDAFVSGTGDVTVLGDSETARAELCGARQTPPVGQSRTGCAGTAKQKSWLILK